MAINAKESLAVLLAEKETNGEAILESNKGPFYADFPSLDIVHFESIMVRTRRADIGREKEEEVLRANEVT